MQNIVVNILKYSVKRNILSVNCNIIMDGNHSNDAKNYYF
jgi:hypothetical protein